MHLWNIICLVPIHWQLVGDRRDLNSCCDLVDETTVTDYVDELCTESLGHNEIHVEWALNEST